MSIEQWVEANFDQVKPANQNLLVCCPFCDTPDTKFHLSISLVKPAAHCFRCDWSGNWFTLIKAVSGVESYSEIYQQLHHPTSMRDFVSVMEQLRQLKAAKRQKLDMPAWFKPFNAGVDNLPYHSLIVLNYALKRLSWQAIDQYCIGYCTEVNNPLALRMIIPVEAGYYQARAINNVTDRKYINPEWAIEGRLFNSKALECRECIYVCEGALSAIATGDASVATLGANGATPEQRKRLARVKAEQFILVVEPEAVAIRQAADLGSYLRTYGHKVAVRQFSVGDPADADSLYQDMSFQEFYWKCNLKI